MPFKHTVNPINYTREKATVTIFGDVTIGASGAPTLVVANSKGITGIVRNSAGDYTVTFDETYNKFLTFWVGFIKATAPSAPTMTVKAKNMNTNGTATVEFVLLAGATPTDPASGEELFIEATFGATFAF